MNGLLEYRLSQEDEGVRRLVWILQMKKPSLSHSRTRRVFNRKRDKQIIILKEKGIKYKELRSSARRYGVELEMII